jgi:hypothetical protein
MLPLKTVGRATLGPAAGSRPETEKEVGSNLVGHYARARERGVGCPRGAGAT